MPNTQPRILIVDDEASLMKALCSTLKEQNYETVGFTSGGEALEELKKTKFNLLLTDLTMPNMDGLSLLRAAIEIDPQLAVVVMTGQGTINTAVEAMKAGALDYILKPFKLSIILPVLSRALALQRLHAENAELEQHLRQRTIELENSNRELVNVNRELESFSYTVSHDLRAPLRHITGFTDLLRSKNETVLDGSSLRYLNLIAEAAKKMNILIEDILSFSRMGRQEMRNIKIDLNALVREVINGLGEEVSRQNISWKIHNLPEVKADLALMEVVFVNLISNAVKYSRPRELTEIEIGFKQEENRTIIFVRDNGVGFDMAHASKLFGVFQRLHTLDQFEGTGIGLATVQRIIHRHGGEIWAESSPDNGATFYFSLPT